MTHFAKQLKRNRSQNISVMVSRIAAASKTVELRSLGSNPCLSAEPTECKTREDKNLQIADRVPFIAYVFIPMPYQKVKICPT